MPQRKPFVLIADDESGFRFSASIALRRAGYRVSGAKDGKEAYEKIVHFRAVGDPVKILLTDLQMPVMTGWELVTALRDEGIDIPVLIITAHDYPSQPARSRAAGVIHVAEKPVDPDELVGRVRDMELESDPPEKRNIPKPPMAASSRTPLR